MVYFKKEPTGPEKFTEWTTFASLAPWLLVLAAAAIAFALLAFKLICRWFPRFWDKI